MLNHINQRFQQFYYDKKDFLRRYAYGDEDLVSIALIAAWNTLRENPDCPESWLVQRSKNVIKNARKSCKSHESLDTTFNEDPLNNLEFSALSYYQRNPEILFLDRAMLSMMWDTLGDKERKLLLILREEYIMETRHRWYQGKYSHTEGERPKPKKRFMTEVSHRENDWYLSFANVRYQFYMHFGTDEEIKREKAWYASFDPNKSRLHANREGR